MEKHCSEQSWPWDYFFSQNDHIGRTSDWKTRGAVNGDGGSLPGGENGKRLMVTEQGGEQLLYSSHYPCSRIKILVVMGIVKKIYRDVRNCDVDHEKRLLLILCCLF